MHKSPKISVLVRTHNDQAHLAPLLDNLISQNPYEIVIADFGSTDQTEQIAKQKKVKFVSVGKGSYGGTLNRGIAQTTGDYVAILNGHAKLLTKTWISDIIKACKSPHVAACYTKQIPNTDSPWFDRFFRAFFYERNISFPALAPFTFSSLGAAIKRDLWQNEHFDESLPACEDHEWALRVLSQDYQIKWIDTPHIAHSHYESFSKFISARYKEISSLLKIYLSTKYGVTQNPIPAKN